MNNLDNHYLSSRDCINASPAVDGGGVAGHGGRLHVGGGGDVGPAGQGDVVAVELVEQSPRLMEGVQTARMQWFQNQLLNLRCADSNIA